MVLEGAGYAVAVTEIPADRSTYGAFTIIDEEVTKRTQGLIEEAARSKAPESAYRPRSDGAEWPASGSGRRSKPSRFIFSCNVVGSTPRRAAVRRWF